MIVPLLFLLPVVVVDVTGDRLDPSHTRKLVEHELSITAVAPDDPRASEATGRIEITGDARDKKLTVRYRKLDEPIERSVVLPDDAGRAESDAAFLAGNLARDEASELAPPVPPSEKKEPDGARALTQLRAFVKQTSADEKSAQMTSGAVQVTAGAALVAGGAAVLATEPKSSEVRSSAHGAALAGGWILGHGLGTLIFERSPLDAVEKKIQEHEKRGTAPAEALEDIERTWAKEAADAKRGRFLAGAVTIGIGAILAGIGTAIVVSTDPSEDPSGPGFGLIGGGAFGMVTGLADMISESPVERSHRLWKTVRATPEPTSRISLGVTALPGGGGAASFALTF